MKTVSRLYRANSVSLGSKFSNVRTSAINAITALIFSFVSVDAFAWSALGHKQQADAAFIRLSDDAQSYYRELSKELNWQPKYKGKGSYDSRQFVELSVLADELRDSSLRDVFGRFEEEVPAALKKFSDQRTANWHYHNAVSDTELATRCNFENRGKLIEVLQYLDTALQTPLTSKQETIVLAFLMHLIEDLHQPLHTFTRIDKNCKADRGGNDTCYKKSFFGSSCKRNLHAQWDRGFGIFKMKSLDIIDASKQNLRFDPQRWVAESLEQYNDVYDLDSEVYEHRARVIVSKNSSLSVARLVHYLQNHYTSNK